MFHSNFIAGVCIAGLLISLGCTRNADDTLPVENPDPGVFSAVVDGIEWKPGFHRAVFIRSRNVLVITARDSSYDLNAGIYIDPSNPLKNYLLEAHGDNNAEIYSGYLPYNSDHNVAGPGGFLLLTKMDTINKIVSGNLQFEAHAPDRTSKIVFSQNVFTDIPLTIDTSSYNGSNAYCTVTGASTTNWYSKNVSGRISCVADVTDKTLELEIASVLGGSSYHRYILLRIPLNNPVGAYAVYPDLPPFFYCGNLNITARYNVNNYNNSYYATSGIINITHIDTAARKLSANFTINFKDTSSRQETIQVSNGQFTLNKW